MLRCRKMMLARSRAFSSAAAAAAAPQGEAASQHNIFDSPATEVLRLKQAFEPKQARALASILKARMQSRLPTYLEGAGPGAMTNGVKCIMAVNGMSRSLAGVPITAEELKTLQATFKDAASFKFQSDILDGKFTADMQLYDLVKAFERVEGQDLPPVAERERDPSKIPFDAPAEEAREQLKKKLESPDASVNLALIKPLNPMILGYIPMQGTRNEEMSTVKMEPVILSQTRTFEKAEQMYPPSREKIVAGAEMFAQRWRQNLLNGVDMTIRATGKESVANTIKMCLTAQRYLQQENVSGFCLHPYYVKVPAREAQDGQDALTEMTSIQMDLYRL